MQLQSLTVSDLQSYRVRRSQTDRVRGLGQANQDEVRVPLATESSLIMTESSVTESDILKIIVTVSDDYRE